MHALAMKSCWIEKLARPALAAALALLVTTGAFAGDDAAVKTGLGTYYTAPKGGLFGSGDSPPVAEYRSGEARGKAAPTNQWYSSVMFQRWSQPLHAHPMTYRAGENGFELGLPDEQLVVDERGVKREIQFPHVAAVTVAPTAFKPADARLSRFSDWLVQVEMGDGEGRSLKATVLHGSPFSYYECSDGDVTFRLADAPRVLAGAPGAAGDPRLAAFATGGHAYAVFAPTGARFEWVGPAELVLRLPAAARYFSVAGLPDDSAATRDAFLALAYAFPTETRVEWAYDQKSSTVRTTFRVDTVAREGDNLTTFMGLYPHHWSSVLQAPKELFRYETVRGPVRLVAGNSFAVERVYSGTLPVWGGLEGAEARKNVGRLMVGDLAKADLLFNKQGRGTYWIGKGLGATAQLLSVAEAEGEMKTRDKLLGKLKDRFEDWFDGRRSTYFMYDAGLGTFVGFPQEYASVSHMNDHHFHYGYWIMGAAHIALRDPAWAAEDQWGGMVARIIADIATDERGLADFPFLRNFDPYEGHSWASGDADFGAGNNQESSSEAVNAWAGLILWGEATRNARLRDLGIYLFTSEIASINQYWFDLDRQVLAPQFGKLFASMVFGGAYAYNTWWTQEPRQITGINLLPITPSSTYLGQDPGYVVKVMNDLPEEVKLYRSRGGDDGTPKDIWQDVLASYLALADASAGYAFWDRSGTVEAGETRTHTLYWLESLKEMGSPDLTVTADTPLYSVFRRADGTRSYLAYNAGGTPIRVTFSTGKTLDVPPRSLARVR